MAEKTGTPITLASRDSLLALAQTIETAQRLEAAGFSPRIVTLKTAGDLKLDAPLYSVAGGAGKEGRAFFTRELDEALISGKTDAAVHSFKDLPTEEIAGISPPVFFSETTGADVFVSRENLDPGDDTKTLVIGTSSLRRIHQLGIAYPHARTGMLRGNIVTRLRKLIEADRGMNAIVIAGAGLDRLKKFAALAAETYAHFIENSTADHIASELEKFGRYLGSGVFIRPLSETYFPTAPGQGVLALQMSAAVAPATAERVRNAFPEHEKIAARVMLERGIMAQLAAGCHAPLGVSAFYGQTGNYDISVCFSRRVSVDPVAFSESVFIRRTVSGNLKTIADEVRQPYPGAFWWGLKPAPAAALPNVWSIRAIDQIALETPAPATAFASVFAASPAVMGWLKTSGVRGDIRLFAAGEETARALRADFPDAHITTEGRGFAAVFRNMPTPALWLGSKSGESRAREIARATQGFTFLPLYENRPLAPAELAAEGLRDEKLLTEALHLMTSAAAAEAFAAFWGQREKSAARLSCFGESAAEVLRGYGFAPHHISDAGSFAEYAAEVRGDTDLMKKRG